MTDYSGLIKRLLSVSSTHSDAANAAEALEAQAREIERLEEANVFCRSAFSSSQERIAELEAENKTLRKALEPLPRAIRDLHERECLPADSHVLWSGLELAARAALNGERG